MKHRKKGRKLNRSASHRTALRRNMASALLRRERIITTPAKAKAVRPFVERLITLARRALPHKDGDEQDRGRYLHYYRQALGRLQDKEMVQKLFGEGDWREEGQSLAERYAERPGGYTRIVRLGGSRLGVPMGAAVGEPQEFIYEIDGEERRLKMTGNRLGDNAPRVLFELVESRMPGEAAEEEAPAVTIGGEEGESSEDQEDEE